MVIGVDSATTLQPASPSGIDLAIRHFNHAQKLFEVGEQNTNGSLMIATYGLASFGKTSHRTLVAEFSDILGRPEHSNKSIQEVAEIWNDLVWDRFSQELQPQIDQAKALAKKPPAPDPLARTVVEEQIFQSLSQYFGGFYLAGRYGSARQVVAYKIEFHWNSKKKPVVEIPVGSIDIQGIPQFILRLLNGYDPGLLIKIAADPRWSGDENDLKQLVGEFARYHGYELPIRDLIEMVYSFIYCTIKAIRFSPLAPICGGPIEIATITTDRRFRWVSHKDLNVAIHHSLFNETRHA